ncbi:MAG: 2,4-dienoyl-CoA reductase-like NADH-dependent reductase (Old Yellow Enzyme family) [Candidatus Azotimanducaceae bacterium]
MIKIKKIPAIKSALQLQEIFSEFGYKIPVAKSASTGNATNDSRIGTSSSALGTTIAWGSRTIGNRYAILPMEGWDAEVDGQPSELLERRWLNFAGSGAKLLWGCEAAAVNHNCRANPRQLVINEDAIGSISSLYKKVRNVHREKFGTDEDLVVGLQLTHSGRWSRPSGIIEPLMVYRHAELDQRVNGNDRHLMSDDDIEALAQLYVDRAVLAAEAGFDFVDVKHCHGYFAHELLSGVSRGGRYGGSFENRTRFLKEVVAGVRSRSPGLGIGVRLSAYDFVPYGPGSDGTGEPVDSLDGYRFGGDHTGVGIDLTETFQFLSLLEDLDIQLVCITAGSPYYNPHIQRPARYPPSDGYQPPEDPLIGVARMIKATADLKARFPNLIIVGSGYTYLQEWFAHVAEGLVENRMVDSVGIGRMVLSYPDLPDDLLSGRGMARKKICRTFSDCTTAPRKGLISGCYPLDPFYKDMPEADELKVIKKTLIDGDV